MVLMLGGRRLDDEEEHALQCVAPEAARKGLVESVLKQEQLPEHQKRIQRGTRVKQMARSRDIEDAGGRVDRYVDAEAERPLNTFDDRDSRVSDHFGHAKHGERLEVIAKLLQEGLQIARLVLHDKIDIAAGEIRRRRRRRRPVAGGGRIRSKGNDGGAESPNHEESEVLLFRSRANPPGEIDQLPMEAKVRARVAVSHPEDWRKDTNRRGRRLRRARDRSSDRLGTSTTADIPRFIRQQMAPVNVTVAKLTCPYLA
jgi:hypothetical protein